MACSCLQLSEACRVPVQAAWLCQMGLTAQAADLGLQLSAVSSAGAELLAEVSDEPLLVPMHCCQQVHLSSMLLLQAHAP